MSRFALFILTLHLPLYIHTADPKKTDSPDSSSDTSASSSKSDDFSKRLSIDSPSRLAHYEDHVDISGMESYAEILGISADPNSRSTMSALLRWGAKQSGSLRPDIAGVGSLEERRRTERTLGKFETMLTPEQEELDQEIVRQTIERQTAAMSLGISLLKALHSSNTKKPIPDILIKIQAAQQLLMVNEHAVLPPALTEAIKQALAIARDKTAHQMNQQTEE